MDTFFIIIPYSIPLNDEFLTAFGKREKEYDELMGRSVDIDQTSLDVVDVIDSDDEEGAGGKLKPDVNYGAISTGKVSWCCRFMKSTQCIQLNLFFKYSRCAGY